MIPTPEQESEPQNTHTQNTHTQNTLPLSS